VATVATKIISEHPNFYPLYAQRQYTYNNIRQDNRNMLLGRDPAIDGMKTGYTESRRLLPGDQCAARCCPTGRGGC
jgi:serine-type D-Ala-D-Ala carboxypeptidase (penicillin-binding protein 5/6)